MSPRQYVDMIRLLPNLPANAVGAVASGQVDTADYEAVLIPAVQAALEKYGSVRVLYVLGPEFTGFTAGAMWEDAKLGVSHLRAWERLAVVSDLGWVAHALEMFRFLLPCPAKVFANKDRAQAEAWIAA